MTILDSDLLKEGYVWFNTRGLKAVGRWNSESLLQSTNEDDERCVTKKKMIFNQSPFV